MKDKRSMSSAIIENALRLSGVRKRFETKEYSQKSLKRAMRRNAKPYKFPKLIRKKAKIEKAVCDSMDYYIVNKHENAKNIILYMHGGGYVDQPLYFHWKFIEEVALNTDYTIYVPIYPKAPNCTYVECYKKVLSLYLEIIYGDTNTEEEFESIKQKNISYLIDRNTKTSNDEIIENNTKSKADEKNIVFMGDSAGGGFILAFAQYLRNNKIKKNASNIIMLSPWLDMSLSNPELKKFESIDPSLCSVGIVEMAKTWAGGSPFENYMLSPINGTFEDLGKMTLFVGTHELLLPDARKFNKMITDLGIKMYYFEFEYMNHVFPLIPFIPEGKEARDIIYHILNNAKN